MITVDSDRAMEPTVQIHYSHISTITCRNNQIRRVAVSDQLITVETQEQPGRKITIKT